MPKLSWQFAIDCICTFHMLWPLCMLLGDFLLKLVPGYISGCINTKKFSMVPDI
uniref:Uncharacterized protein n=1 Tax=Arundo donax TaxID=35708 RepID=A0A0A9AQW6_ARUDO